MQSLEHADVDSVVERVYAREVDERMRDDSEDDMDFDDMEAHYS